MEKIRKSETKVHGIGAGTLELRKEISLLVDSKNTFAKVTFLIDERTERVGDQSKPIILGTNGLAALGYSLFSPDGKSLMTSTNHVAEILKEWKRSPKHDKEAAGVGICREDARMPTGGMSESAIVRCRQPLNKRQ